MSKFHDAAKDSLQSLFSHPVSAERFKSWRTDLVPDIGRLLSGYGLGEIFWKKSLGRPKTASLSQAFTVEAWRDEEILVGDVGGAAHWQLLRVPYAASWWDGKDDAEHWRVPYMIPSMAPGEATDGVHNEYTHIVPHMVPGVRWDGDGAVVHARIGFRAFHPQSAVFVKGPATSHFSFEVVLEPLLVSP